MRLWRLALAGSVVLASAQARTIVLTDTNVTHMAALNDQLPHASWAGWEPSSGSFTTTLLNLPTVKGILIQYPLDAIPRAHRIVNAELSLPVYSTQAGARVYVWRLLVDWGVGVRYLFRRVRPERVEWSVAGADGVGVDRALEPTNVVVVQRGDSHFQLSFNVTKDVELWHAGAAANHGWLLATDENGLFINFKCPVGQPNLWQLTITHEPN